MSQRGGHAGSAKLEAKRSRSLPGLCVVVVFALYSDAMTDICFVFRCNSTRSDSVSLHLLPRQTELRERWIQFIWRHRDDPAKISTKTRVCSLHFLDNCFENLTRKNMGFATKLILKADAVPTLYPGDRASRSGLVGEVVSLLCVCVSVAGADRYVSQSIHYSLVRATDTFTFFPHVTYFIDCFWEVKRISTKRKVLQKQFSNLKVGLPFKRKNVSIPQSLKWHFYFLFSSDGDIVNYKFNRAC